MSVDVSEQAVLEALQKVPRERWGQVIQFLQELAPKPLKPPRPGGTRPWTVAELLALPREECDAILERQAALAEGDYRADPELTAFEAFGPDDLYVDDADTPPR